MYLKCNWIQLFLLLCSFPLPSFWWNTDTLRTRQVQCSHSGMNYFVIYRDSDLRKAEFFYINHHPDIQVPLYLARILYSTHVWHAPRTALVKVEEKACSVPVLCLSSNSALPTLLRPKTLPTVFYLRVFLQVSPAIWWTFLPPASPGSSHQSFP